MLWERFMLTGRIVDYLRYKHSSEAVENDNAKVLDNKRRAGRREQ